MDTLTDSCISYQNMSSFGALLSLTVMSCVSGAHFLLLSIAICIVLSLLRAKAANAFSAS